MTIRLVSGIPVVAAQWNSHEIKYNSDCPLDVLDPHIHIGGDYSDGRVILTAFGRGVDRVGSHRPRLEVPVTPSWWDRLWGRTPDAALRHVAHWIATTTAAHERDAAALDRILDR